MSALLRRVEIEAVIAVLDAAWKREVADWWTAKRECAESDYALRDQGGCGCSYKDCYDHGKDHACSHGEPDWGPRAIEAVTRQLAGTGGSEPIPPEATATNAKSDWPCLGRSSGRCRHDSCNPNRREK